MVQIEGKTAIIFDREVRRQIAHLMAPYVLKSNFFFVVLNEETGEWEESSKFMRFAYEHSDFPLRFLVRYVGDAMIQNQFCHRKTKSDEKKTRNYVSTKKSTRDKMKTEPGVPSNV